MGGCHFDKEAAKLFIERANNVGLIIPGIAPLRDTFWGKWLWQNPKMFEELKEFMDEIHKAGAKLFVQLTAGMGRQPACMLFANHIDSLAAAGAVLADVWVEGSTMPVIDCLGDEFLDYVKTGMTVTVKEDGIVCVD